MAHAKDQSQKYDQDFFLALAAKGKDAWNEWRRNPANKDVRVTFAGIDFSEAPRDEIDFSGFEFRDHADFSGCKWRGGIVNHNAFLPGPAFFTSAVFGDRASFNRAVFGNRASFVGANFGVSAHFEEANFGDNARFANAVFGDEVIFMRAAFGQRATFAGQYMGHSANFAFVTFGGYANFDGRTFGDVANFTSATFGNGASFAHAAFGDTARFDGAAFGRGARFNNAHFKGGVEFTGKSNEQWARDLASEYNMEDQARAALEKRHKVTWETNGTGPGRFLFISYAKARFDGEADFSGRSFEQIADFTCARFYYPPNFDAAANVGRIDFTGAYIRFVPRGKLIHCTKNSRIPLLLRAFRKIAEETKNHDLERDLYIEERKAERGVYWRQLSDERKKAPEELRKKLEDIDKEQREVWSNWRHRAWARNAHRLGIAVKVARLAVHGFWIFVMLLYWALANYGRSFLLPAAWLGLSVPLFHCGYDKFLAPFMPQAGTLDAAKYARAEWMVALGNAVPFVGPLTIDAEIKKFLFCPGFGKCLPFPPEGFQLLVIAQNLFSITCVFFIGLALRNYFRIK